MSVRQHQGAFHHMTYFRQLACRHFLHPSQFVCPAPKPTVVYICHCTICRRQSGSAFGISAIFPAFTIDSANSDCLREFARPTASGKTMRCYFCSNCGSRLMHARDGVASVSVKGGSLPGLTKDMVAGAVHIWTKEAIVDIPAGVESLEGEPSDD